MLEDVGEENMKKPVGRSEVFWQEKNPAASNRHGFPPKLSPALQRQRDSPEPEIRFEEIRE